MKHLLKKKNINTLFWITIYTLPILIVLIQSIHHTPTLYSIVESMGIFENNIIYNTIIDIFGNNGALQLFTQNSGIVYYFTYFISMNILHIGVDVILLLPRIAQSFADKINNSGDDVE